MPWLGELGKIGRAVILGGAIASVPTVAFAEGSTNLTNPCNQDLTFFDNVIGHKLFGHMVNKYPGRLALPDEVPDQDGCVYNFADSGENPNGPAFIIPKVYGPSIVTNHPFTQNVAVVDKSGSGLEYVGWRQNSGPGKVIFKIPNSLSTPIGFTQDGEYSYELDVLTKNRQGNYRPFTARLDTVPPIIQVDSLNSVSFTDPAPASGVKSCELSKEGDKTVVTVFDNAGNSSSIVFDSAPQAPGCSVKS